MLMKESTSSVIRSWEDLAADDNVRILLVRGSEEENELSVS